MQRFGKASAATLAAAGVIALAACSSGGGSTAASNSGGSGAASGSSSKAPYTIGYVNTLSGPISTYGQYTYSFLQALSKSVNASGGINGHQLNVVPVDSAAAGVTGVSAVKQLISQSHPIAIYGNNLSDDCGAEAPIVTAAQIPMICASTPAADLSPLQKYVFAGAVSEPTEANAVVQLATGALKVPKGGTYATFVAGSLGAEQYATAAGKAAEAAGLKKSDSEIIPLSVVNAGPEISKLVASKPSVVFGEPVGSQIQPLVQALRAAGNNAPVIIVDYSITLAEYQSIKDANLYGDSAANFIDSGTVSQSGVAQVQKMLTDGGMKGEDAMNGAQGPSMALPVLGLIQGLKQCGDNCTGAQLADALEKVTLNYPGYVSDYGWSPTSHYPVHNVSFYSLNTSTNLPQLKAGDLPVGKP